MNKTDRNLKHFRSSQCPIEIEEFFRYFSKCNLDIMAWQTSREGKRMIAHLSVDHFQRGSEFIELLSNIESFDFKRFNKKQKLNLHCAYKQLICQVEILDITKNSIFAKFPEIIHTESLTRKPRKQFLTFDNKVKFLKQATSYEYPIIDISESGMAVSIPRGPAKVFNYADDEIIIDQFFNKSLDSQLRGNVVYIQQEDDQSRFRVGIKFQRSFPFRQFL